MKDARYDQMMAAFGGVGVYATTPDELNALSMRQWTMANQPWSMRLLMKIREQRAAALAILTRKVLCRKNSVAPWLAWQQ